MMVTSGEGEGGMKLGRDTQGLQLYNILFPYKRNMKQIWEKAST